MLESWTRSHTNSSVRQPSCLPHPKTFASATFHDRIQQLHFDFYYRSCTSRCFISSARGNVKNPVCGHCVYARHVVNRYWSLKSYPFKLAFMVLWSKKLKGRCGSSQSFRSNVARICRSRWRGTNRSSDISHSIFYLHSTAPTGDGGEEGGRKWQTGSVEWQVREI